MLFQADRAYGEPLWVYTSSDLPSARKIVKNALRVFGEWRKILVDVTLENQSLEIWRRDEGGGRVETHSKSCDLAFEQHHNNTINLGTFYHFLLF